MYKRLWHHISDMNVLEVKASQVGHSVLEVKAPKIGHVCIRG